MPLEPGYPGSGDAATMPPPPSDPSGYAPATFSPPGYVESDRFPASEWFKAQLREAQAAGRALDPVRAAALHEAVRFFPHSRQPVPDPDVPKLAELLAAAKMFEAWLQGPAAFDRYLAEDESTEAP